MVGIVARRDLLRLIARSDDDIRAELEGRLKEELDALQRLTVAVDGGVVTLDAAVSPLGRRLFEGLARTVPGVVEVRTSQGADRTQPTTPSSPLSPDDHSRAYPEPARPLRTRPGMQGLRPLTDGLIRERVRSEG